MKIEHPMLKQHNLELEHTHRGPNLVDNKEVSRREFLDAVTQARALLDDEWSEASFMLMLMQNQATLRLSYIDPEINQDRPKIINCEWMMQQRGQELEHWAKVPILYDSSDDDIMERMADYPNDVSKITRIPQS